MSTHPKRRPICIIAAVFNISAYLTFFFNELPKSKSGTGRNLTVNATNPLSISAPSSLSQSGINIDIWRDFCPRPIVRVRLVGPQVHIFPPFTLDSNSTTTDDNTHSFSVNIQKLSLLVGVYRVDASLIRCHGEGKSTEAIINDYDTKSSCRIDSEWNNVLNIGGNDSNDNIWRWVHSPKCNSQSSGEQRSPECAQPGTHPNQADYILMEINSETNGPAYDNLVTLKDGMTTLSKPTSLLADSSDGSSNLQYFSELSNYELVCWLGDDDAQKYFRAFMDLYPLMGSRGQRPFKFKYISLRDTSIPTKDISDATQMTYDKCKIFFVSYGIDRIDAGISPKEYGQEIETLLGHIEKSHSDETYPVWFLSTRSSTSIPDEAGSCIDDGGYQGRVPDRIHAFNEEARRVFYERQKTEPKTEPRIHFMDNTHITEAFWQISTKAEDSTSNMHIMESQVTSAVAMRCIEKIAHQVKFWRSKNQIGVVNGLMRDGKLIPNSELYKQPYTWGK